MAESDVPLKILGISISFEILDGSQKIVSTGAIPIHDKDISVFEKSSLIKCNCEKCNQGELIFDPTKEYTETTFTHVCTNCGNVEVFDKFYPSVRLLDEAEMEKIKSFTFTFIPLYFTEDDKEMELTK